MLMSKLTLDEPHASPTDHTPPSRAPALAMSSAADVVIATTFPRFPELPRELQLTVWQFALPRHGSVVEIEWCSTLKAWFCPSESNERCALLSACATSRAMYLKSWFPLAPRYASNVPYAAARPDYISEDTWALCAPERAGHLPVRPFNRWEGDGSEPPYTASTRRYQQARREVLGSFPVTYFNPLVDTLYMTSTMGADSMRGFETALPPAQVQLFQQVKKLAYHMDYIHPSTLRGLVSKRISLTAMMLLMKSLEFVSVAFGDPGGLIRKRQNISKPEGSIVLWASTFDAADRHCYSARVSTTEYDLQRLYSDLHSSRTITVEAVTVLRGQKAVERASERMTDA